MVAIPPELLAQFRQHNVLLFIGDRIGQNDDGRFIMNSLLESINTQLGDEYRENSSFPEAAQAYEDEYGREKLTHFLQHQIDSFGKNPHQDHYQIAGLKHCQLFFTTCIDGRLEKAFQEAGRSLEIINLDFNPIEDDPVLARLFKLHGSIDKNQKGKFTEEDYETFLGSSAPIPANLVEKIAQRTILFIGCDLNDPYFKRLYRKLVASMDIRAQSKYVVVELVDAKVTRWCDRQSLTLIEAGLTSFLQTLTNKLRQSFPMVTPQTRLPEESSVPAISKYPYKLLDYYRSEDAAIFYGRHREIQQLSSLIHYHSLVLLYGTSGTGKTSLLLAGVQPLLKQINSSYEFIYVRALEEPGVSIRRAIKRKILESAGNTITPSTPIVADDVDMPVLREMIDAYFNESELADLCFGLNIDYQHLPGNNKWDIVRELIIYCNRRGRLRELIDACRVMRSHVSWPGDESKDSTSLHGILPGDVSTLSDFLYSAARILDSKFIIILDQFEEFFIRFNLELRTAFFRVLGDIYNTTELPVKIVISLREDWLASISEIERFIPEVFRTRIRLLPFTREQAYQAITAPVENSGISYEPQLVTFLLDDLVDESDSADSSGSVMPPQLQLVCNALYERVMADKRQITISDYDSLGGGKGVLSQYLVKELGRIPREERALAESVLEAAVSSKRTRKVVTGDELALSLGVDRSDLSPVLEKLVRAHLLRPIEQEMSLGYELVHDYLAQSIEITQEAIDRKAVEELVDQELRNWLMLHTLISPDRLRIISAWRDQLRLSQAAQELIERSIEKKELDKQIQLDIIQSDKMIFLNRLVAGIDKEISSPIASINSNSDLLRDAVNEIKEILQNNRLLEDQYLEMTLDDINEISNELEQAAQKMTRLIRLLSNLAQPDQAENHPVEIQSSLEAALLLLEHQTIKHRIKIRCILDDNVVVDGSSSQLVQLFMNLLMGSIEAVKKRQTEGDEGRIEIKVHKDDSWGIVNFAHNGRKFHSADLEKLFDFEIISDRESIPRGLNFSIAFQIVQRHNGTIEIIRDEPKMNTLEIKLPLINPVIAQDT